MNLRQLPNAISVVRILLVIPVAVLLVRQQFGIALVLFLIAAVSDAVDGYLARRFGWATWLGGWLDPLADKALLVSAYLALGWLGLIPVWLVVAVIVRDAVISLGSVAYNHWIESVGAEPSWISKFNTLVQILLVIAVVVDQVMALPNLWIEVLQYTVLVTVLLSGFGYVATWGSRAWRKARARD